MRFIVSLAVVMPLIGSSNDLLEIQGKWDVAEAALTLGEAGPRGVKDAARTLEEAAQKLRTWLMAQGPDFHWENEQQREKWDLLDFKLANAWARAKDYNKALAYLEKEALEYQKSEGQFLENTRNPLSFAFDVFTLHSEILANTGTVASIPGAGYKVLAVSSKSECPAFAFIYEPVGDDEGGVMISGLAKDEQRQVIQLSVPEASGRYRMAGSAQVIGKRSGIVGSVQSSANGMALVLDGVTKFIAYQGEFRIPVVHSSPRRTIRLRVTGGEIEQPLQALK